MTSEQQLKGRVAIVTGASRGIGAGIAKRFAAEGAKLVLVARTLEPSAGLPGSLTEVAEFIRSQGGECEVLQANIAYPADRARIVPFTLECFGRCDILINNVAWCRYPPVWEAESKHVRLAFEINVFAPQELSQAVFAPMSEQGAGWILNISSATADALPSAPYDFSERAQKFNRDGHATIYGTSKAALERLSSGWAIEASKYNIAVNSLAPVAVVLSEGAKALGTFTSEDHVEPVEAMAEAALQLCSRPANVNSGNTVKSLPYLESLGVVVRGLDGQKM
jgi:NAD(P)-dependent dehydrogenase (short-subunit alcohol dehydrogenase family)